MLGNRVLTFGETMIRLTPPGRRRLAQANSVDMWLAGCESNVAAGLASLGVAVSWVGRLPDNIAGRRVSSELAALGVDVSHIVWTDAAERVGLIFAESGADPRPTHVLYDRAGSAASKMTPADVPDSLIAAHTHLHVSGITPALSTICRDTATDVLARANRAGVSVSFDINYRAKLWAAGDAAAVLEPMVRAADIVFCSRADAERLFGIVGAPGAVATALRSRWRSKAVIVTAGADGAAVCEESGVCLAGVIALETSVDRFGSGDAFAAGFLAARMEGRPTDGCLRLAVAAAAYKRTIPGDMLIASRTEVEAVAAQEETVWR